jgi:hypothetical protein
MAKKHEHELSIIDEHTFPIAARVGAAAGATQGGAYSPYHAWGSGSRECSTVSACSSSDAGTPARPARPARKHPTLAIPAPRSARCKPRTQHALGRTRELPRRRPLGEAASPRPCAICCAQGEHFPFARGAAIGAQRLNVPAADRRERSEHFQTLDRDLRERRDGYR